MDTCLSCYLPLKQLLMTRGMWPFIHDKTYLSLIHPPITNIYLSSSFLLPHSSSPIPHKSTTSPPTPRSLPNQDITSKPPLILRAATMRLISKISTVHRLRAQEDVHRPPTRPSKDYRKGEPKHTIVGLCKDCLAVYSGKKKRYEAGDEGRKMRVWEDGVK